MKGACSAVNGKLVSKGPLTFRVQFMQVNLGVFKARKDVAIMCFMLDNMHNCCRHYSRDLAVWDKSNLYKDLACHR